MNEVSSVQIIDRTFAVLECVAENGALGLNDLFHKLGINKASLLRICNALCSNGYLNKNNTTGTFSLSLKAFEVGVSAVRKLDYLDLVRDVLESLSEETGAISQFSIDENNELLCLECVDNNSNSFSVYTHIGSRTQLYATSAGKAILSAYPNELIREKWAAMNIVQFTANTITDFEDFMVEIAKTRARNYAVDMAESEPGLYCIGTVLMNYNKKPLGAISLSVPHLSAEDEARLSSILLKHTQRLSYMLGYSHR